MISIVAIQILGIIALGFIKYSKRFLIFKPFEINHRPFELLGEFTKSFLFLSVFSAIFCGRSAFDRYRIFSAVHNSRTVFFWKFLPDLSGLYFRGADTRVLQSGDNAGAGEEAEESLENKPSKSGVEYYYLILIFL